MILEAINEDHVVIDKTVSKVKETSKQSNEVGPWPGLVSPGGFTSLLVKWRPNGSPGRGQGSS